MERIEYKLEEAKEIIDTEIPGFDEINGRLKEIFPPALFTRSDRIEKRSREKFGNSVKALNFINHAIEGKPEDKKFWFLIDEEKYKEIRKLLLSDCFYQTYM